MRSAVTIAVALAAWGAGAGTCLAGDLQDFSAVERGRYLATAADCGSCHTVPGSDQPFGGGRRDRDAVRRAGRAQHHARPRDRNRRLDRRSIRRRGPGRRQPQRRAALSGDAVSLLQPDVARGREGHPRLSQHHQARFQRGQGESPAVSVEYPRVDDRLGQALFHAGRISSRRVQIAGMESRRLSRAGPGALRRLPHAEDVPGRRQDHPKRCRVIRCRAGPRPTSQAGRARCATGRPRISRPT